MKKSVFCLVNNSDHAEKMIELLVKANFSKDDISILASDSGAIHTYTSAEFKDSISKDPIATENIAQVNIGDLEVVQSTKAPEGSSVGAVTGGIVGGAIGLLAGLGAIAIPGLGVFVAAGPIVAALSGSAVGGATGLLVGALIGSGIPEYEAKEYEAGVKGGKILLSIVARDSEQVDKAKEIMGEAGGESISTSADDDEEVQSVT